MFISINFTMIIAKYKKGKLHEETNDSGCQSLKQRKCECPRSKLFYGVEFDRYRRQREFSRLMTKQSKAIPVKS